MAHVQIQKYVYHSREDPSSREIKPTPNNTLPVSPIHFFWRSPLLHSAPRAFVNGTQSAKSP